MITGNPEIKVIYGGNRASAMGAAAEAENLGGDVGAIGYGAQEEVEAILEGMLLASIMRDP
jgi:ABC-type sugar transport system substrate-binding protein